MTSRKPLAPRRQVPIDANALDLFARIVAAGSFASAARGLGLTRAAVSRRVRTLETALGQPLFARTTRALGLTEAGRALAAKARAVAEATDAARVGFRRRGTGYSGTLRVTAAPMFGHRLLAPLVARFMAQHPQLRVELTLTNRRVDLLREEVDVAFRVTQRPPEDWVARPIARFAVRAWARPRDGLPLAAPEALAAEPCLVFTPPTDSVALQWRRATNTTRVEVAPACASDDLSTLVALALHGRGIVFAPDFMVDPLVAAGELVDVLPGWTLALPAAEQLWALTLAHPAAPEAARALVQAVAEAFSPPEPAR